jgi:hypothetical protein
MSDRPKAPFTMPRRARDITAAALGTLFALISAGRSRAASHPQGPGLMGAQHEASPTRSGGEVTLKEPPQQQTDQWPRQRRRRPF